MTEEQLHIVQEINTSDLCSIISSRNSSLEDEIRRLKNENKLLGERCNQLLADKGKLTDENTELRNNGFTVSAMTEQQLKVALKKGEQLEKENAELKKKCYKKAVKDYCELEKENAELKEQLKSYNGCGDWDNDFHTCRVYLQHEELQMYADQLTKAKVALRNVIDYLGQFCSDYPDCVIEAEKILKEE